MQDILTVPNYETQSVYKSQFNSKFIFKGLLSVNDEFLNLNKQSLYFYKSMMCDTHPLSNIYTIKTQSKLNFNLDKKRLNEFSFQYKVNASPLILDSFNDFSLKKNKQKESRNYNSSYYLNLPPYNNYNPIYNIIDKTHEIKQSFYNLELIFLDIPSHLTINSLKNNFNLVRLKKERSTTFKLHFKILNSSNRELESLLYRINFDSFKKYPLLDVTKNFYLLAKDYRFEFSDIKFFFKPLSSLGLREIFDEKKPRRGSVLWNELKNWFPNFEREIKEKLKLRDFNFEEVLFLKSYINFNFNLKKKLKRYLNKCYMHYYFLKENTINFIPFKYQKKFFDSNINKKIKYSKSFLKLIEKQKKKLLLKSNSIKLNEQIISEVEKRIKVNFYGKIKFLPENKLIQHNAYNYFFFENNREEMMMDRSIYRYPFELFREYQIFRRLRRQYERKLLYSPNFQSRFYKDNIAGIYKIYKDFTPNDIDDNSSFSLICSLFDRFLAFFFHFRFHEFFLKQKFKQMDFFNLDSGSGFGVDDLFVKYKLSSVLVKNMRRKTNLCSSSFETLNSDLIILKNQILYDYSNFLNQTYNKKERYFDKSLIKNHNIKFISTDSHFAFKTHFIRKYDNHI